jgi:hypothetical protein
MEKRKEGMMKPKLLFWRNADSGRNGRWEGKEEWVCP